jgi:hypothetical protein
MLDRVDKRTSSQAMLFGALGCALAAGMRLDRGMTDYMNAKTQSLWIMDFALSSLLLVVAFRWALPTLKRAKAGQSILSEDTKQS